MLFFGFLVMSPLGFKARVGSALFAFCGGEFNVHQSHAYMVRVCVCIRGPASANELARARHRLLPNSGKSNIKGTAHTSKPCRPSDQSGLT